MLSTQKTVIVTHVQIPTLQRSCRRKSDIDINLILFVIVMITNFTIDIDIDIICDIIN